MSKGIVLLALPLLLCSIGLQAQPAPDFEQCKAALAQRARGLDIDAAVIASVFDNIKQIPRVIDSDRQQPEFTSTFTEYYQRRVTPTRIDKGRLLKVQHDQLLNRIGRQTGVPPQYLVALWGLETNFGSYFGKLPIPSALATLACDQRRAEFFARELMATLKIIAAGDLDQATLIGSWAGAIGHMQFMPTTYLAYAKDGNADGRRDLLGSHEDALTSGAHYLQSLGWKPGFRWGREVLLPENFDYAQSGFDQWRTLDYWAQRGVTDTFGEALPALEINAAIVLPSGHRGPAFVLYDNFKVLMGWNRSINYAISVGRLADRIAGAGALAVAPPDKTVSRVSITKVKDLQAQLNALGYDAGKPDGVIGANTRRALRRYQTDKGLIADGYPNPEVFVAITGSAG